MNQDIQHLRLLSIFYYIVGGLLILFALLVLIYALFMGMVFATAPPYTGAAGGGPPAAVSWLFVLLFSGLSLLLFAWAVCLMIAGWHLSRRKHYMYCLVMGCTATLFQPFGTILGVFAILVLIRPSVKRIFETGELPSDPEEDDAPHTNYDDHLSASYNIHRK